MANLECLGQKTNVCTTLWDTGNLPQELQQLTITPIDTTIDVRWRVQHDGHVVDGLKTERFALWTSSNKRLLITLPERGASDARFMEHVQQVAFELARCVRWLLLVVDSPAATIVQLVYTSV